MAFALIRKWLVILFRILFAWFGLYLLVAISVAIYATNQPYIWKIGPVWVCENPYIYYEASESTNNHGDLYKIKIDGTIRSDVELLELHGNGWVMVQDGIDEKLMFGELYRYNKADGTMIYYVQEDNVFGGAYSKLIFHQVDPSEMGADPAAGG